MTQGSLQTGSAGNLVSPEKVRARKRPRIIEFVSATLIVGSLGCVAHSIVVNRNVHWRVISEYLFHPEIIDGVITTIELTVVSVAVSFILAIVLTFMWQSRNPVLHYLQPLLRLAFPRHAAASSADLVVQPCVAVSDAGHRNPFHVAMD